jgi:hypothetical protein
MELPERVASDLRIIAENIEPLRTAIEQFHELIEYVFRNKEELMGILNTEKTSTDERIPFSLVCERCDTDCPNSQEEAEAVGWTSIEEDLTGLAWNFVGICPDCVKAEAEEDAKRVQAQPIRDWYEIMKSVVDKADGKAYLPLSGVEQHLLLTQKLITKSGKLTKVGKEKFKELDRQKQEAERKYIANEVAAAEARRKPKTLF